MGIIDEQDGQFMLLAGFIIAIGLVITTVILNSIIFEFNMALGSGNELSKNEIINLMDITKDEMRNAYRNSTAAGGSLQNQTSSFNNQTDNFSSHLPKIYALHGEGINITTDISNWNNTIHANFTKNGTHDGTPDWTVVKSVNGITYFGFDNVGLVNYFLVNVTNSSGLIWSINFTGGGDINVTNKSGGVSTHSPGYAFVDVLDPTYEFNTSTSGERYDIDFINGNRSWGAYRIEGNHTTYDNEFYRQRNYVLNATISLSTSKIRANITIPVSVPW